MIFVTDDNRGIIFFGMLSNNGLNFNYTRAGCIDNVKFGLFELVALLSVEPRGP